MWDLRKRVLKTVSGWGVEDGAKNANVALHDWFSEGLRSQPATDSVILGCHYEEVDD